MSKIYDFDSYIERRGTHCVKHDALKENFGRDDLIPLWVADMDFPTPDFIREALVERINHPILGYTIEYDGYWQSIQNWLQQRHGWQVEREWMRYIPGIVKGIGMVINRFTSPASRSASMVSSARIPPVEVYQTSACSMKYTILSFL